MDNNDIVIVIAERKSLSTGGRIFNSMYGLIVVIFCLVNFQLIWLPLIVYGVLSIVYGMVGLELIKTKNSIAISQTEIVIKGSLKRIIKIELKDVKRIILEHFELQVDFLDYSKVYNLSWIPEEEYKRLKERFIDNN